VRVAVLNGKLKLMSTDEKYICPRCGFAFKLELGDDENCRLIRCLHCEKEMNIQNRFQSKLSGRIRKKIHYLHKSLLN
jgi:DNA-directed RNA polymerase subunit RPC12/RpoP